MRRMTPYEAIISKRDLRVYTDQPIPDEVMHRILQAGRMAGSAKNLEANRLIVTTDQGCSRSHCGGRRLLVVDRHMPRR